MQSTVATIFSIRLSVEESRNKEDNSCLLPLPLWCVRYEGKQHVDRSYAALRVRVRLTVCVCGMAGSLISPSPFVRHPVFLLECVLRYEDSHEIELQVIRSAENKLYISIGTIRTSRFKTVYNCCTRSPAVDLPHPFPSAGSRACLRSNIVGFHTPYVIPSPLIHPLPSTHRFSIFCVGFVPLLFRCPARKSCLHNTELTFNSAPRPSIQPNGLFLRLILLAVATASAADSYDVPDVFFSVSSSALPNVRTCAPQPTSSRIFFRLPRRALTANVRMMAPPGPETGDKELGPRFFYTLIVSVEFQGQVIRLCGTNSFALVGVLCVDARHPAWRNTHPV